MVIHFSLFGISDCTRTSECIHQSFSMPLAFFHGEGMLPSVLIYSFLVLIGVRVLIYGLKKYDSRSGFMVAVGYIAVTLIAIFLSNLFRGLFEIIADFFEIVALGLTLPWRMVLPCSYIEVKSCPLTPGVAFVCALLNAAILYFLIVWLTRGKQEVM